MIASLDYSFLHHKAEQPSVTNAESKIDQLTAKKANIIITMPGNNLVWTI